MGRIDVVKIDMALNMSLTVYYVCSIHVGGTSQRLLASLNNNIRAVIYRSYMDLLYFSTGEPLPLHTQLANFEWVGRLFWGGVSIFKLSLKSASFHIVFHIFLILLKVASFDVMKIVIRYMI